MKILHFDFDDMNSPTAGGQAIRTYEINRRLVQKGHEVTVVTLDYPKAIQKVIHEGISYKRSGFSTYPLNFLSYWWKVKSIIKSHEFDLIIEDNIPPFTFGRSPLYTNKPVISCVQTFGGKRATQKHKIPFHLFEERWAKLYKNFIVLTQSMKTKIQNLNPQATIEVIPNGLNHVDPYQAPSLTSASYILFIGRLTWEKGLGNVIEIMKYLQVSQPNLELKIAGSGPDEQKLRHSIQANNLKNIKLIGQISGTQKQELIKNCSLLIQPSHYENFPLTFLEAASLSKPVTAFGIDNVSEIIEQNKIGISIKPFNNHAFAEGIQQLLTNPEELSKYSKNAHQWAQKHLWNDLANQQEKFYEQVVSAHTNK